jgi:hypothetical protein
MSSLISGVKIPDSKLAPEAAELVRQYEDELLFNHSVRVYVFGAMRGIRQKLKFDPELLYVAALFHDLGLVDHYHTETKRFEVDGADAAREFLTARHRSAPGGSRMGSNCATYDARNSSVHAARNCPHQRRGFGGCRRRRI